VQFRPSTPSNAIIPLARRLSHQFFPPPVCYRAVEKRFPLATPNQIAANRRNSLKSTGPRSAAGKAASCFNALKHGIDARSQCLPWENRATLDQLAAEYHERFAPSTPEQRCLVDTLVSCEWELRRYRACGAQLWQRAAHKDIPDDDVLPLADGFAFCQQAFIRLQRLIDSAHRNYHRALKGLQDLQTTEPAPAPPPAQPAIPAPQPPEPAAAAPRPKLASFRKPADPLVTPPPPNPPSPDPATAASTESKPLIRECLE
jgi:hypothetical protein